MIYCNQCFNCFNQVNIIKEENRAKELWQKNHISYIFSCGARYNPNTGTRAEVHANKKTCKNRFYRYPNGIPNGTFNLEFLTWEEVEYLGQLSREGKIKVTGTGKRSLRIVPLSKQD